MLSSVEPEVETCSGSVSFESSTKPCQEPETDKEGDDTDCSAERCVSIILEASWCISDDLGEAGDAVGLGDKGDSTMGMVVKSECSVWRD